MIPHPSVRERATSSTNARGFDLTGKVAVVTGGSRGLGRQIALALAAHGADVVVASRNLEACQAVARAIATETTRRSFAFRCNVGLWSDLDQLVDDVYETVGRVDILVNNAGISPTYSHLSEVDEALFDKTIAVNLKGPFRLSALIGARMLELDGGSIINISSTAAVRPRAQYVPYAAAKAALNAMSEGIARAYGPTVRSNVVMAGPFRTDMTARWDWDAVDTLVRHFALGRVGEPEEIVGAVLYLASNASSFTTGSVLTVDGGEP